MAIAKKIELSGRISQEQLCAKADGCHKNPKTEERQFWLHETTDEISLIPRFGSKSP